MKTLSVALLCGLGAAMAGCEPADPLTDQRAMHTWMIESYNDAAIENAIVSQQSLFAYHFEEGGAALNELGRRDLGVLAEHYRTTPGTLHVQRAGAGETLYQARVSHVKESLVQAGVKASDIQVSDGLAGAGGIDSRRVHIILDRADKPTKTTATTDPLGKGG